MTTRMFRFGLCAILLFGAWAAAAAGQFRVERGLDVSPTFDGWERNPDGTFTFNFGYFNRNASEPLDIPVGPDNSVDGGPDRGQPTHFRVGRHWWVFRIVVPRDWPKDQRLVWTIKSRGRTNQAKAWLQPEWEVDADLIARNSRDGFLFTRGEDVATDLGNRPPSVTGESAQTVGLDQGAMLNVTATDDGRPAPPAQEAKGRARPNGVRFRWIVYRGSASDVHFDPETNGPFATTPARGETKASFRAPGVYRLRAIASDGQLLSTHDIDVTVNPRSPSEPAR
jgi:hypothetical protein